MWVDAVIFVFSLEDEVSFQTVYHYYSRMANYRNTSEIPMVLVGTQGKCNIDHNISSECSFVAVQTVPSRQCHVLPFPISKVISWVSSAGLAQGLGIARTGLKWETNVHAEP